MGHGKARQGRRAIAQRNVSTEGKEAVGIRIGSCHQGRKEESPQEIRHSF